MGMEIQVDSLEEMCSLMCDNVIPKRRKGMTREEAKKVFLNRGFVEVDGGIIFDGNKWGEACLVISEWLEQESTKTGHWIDKEHRKEQYVLIGKCSVCGRVRVLDEFCSNCGARMESEEE